MIAAVTGSHRHLRTDGRRFVGFVMPDRKEPLADVREFESRREVFFYGGLGVADFGGYFSESARLSGQVERLAPAKEVSCASPVRQRTIPRKHCTSLRVIGAALRSAARPAPERLSARLSTFHRPLIHTSRSAARRAGASHVISPGRLNRILSTLRHQLLAPGALPRERFRCGAPTTAGRLSCMSASACLASWSATHDARSTVSP